MVVSNLNAFGNKASVSGSKGGNRRDLVAESRPWQISATVSDASLPQGMQVTLLYGIAKTVIVLINIHVLS